MSTFSHSVRKVLSHLSKFFNTFIYFLTNSFNTLEENNYGYSITNSWEHYKKDDNIVVIEMNFTRFLKDSTIMGAKNRTATYILRKKNDEFKISAMIPHTPVSE